MDFNYHPKDDCTVEVGVSELHRVLTERKLAHKVCKEYNKYYSSADNCLAPCRDLVHYNDQVLTAVIHTYATRLGIIGTFTPRTTLLKAIRVKAATY